MARLKARRGNTTSKLPLTQYSDSMNGSGAIGWMFSSRNSSAAAIPFCHVPGGPFDSAPHGNTRTIGRECGLILIRLLADDADAVSLLVEPDEVRANRSS